MYYTSNYFILCLILICWIFKDEGKYKGEDYKMLLRYNYHLH